MNPLIIFKKKEKGLSAAQNLKDRVLKNKGAVLDIMGENLEGNRSCPRLLGQPCVGKFCMFFMEFKSSNDAGEETSFWNCVDVQMPLLTIELNRNIRILTDKISKEG